MEHIRGLNTSTSNCILFCVNHCVFTFLTGYGDTTSVLTFQLTQSDASAVYKCAADVGEYSDALYDQILIQSEGK